jgi:CBS domain containing-hemolysin-like protein
MNSITVNLLIAIFLLAANAFYVAAEFALVKSRGFRVKTMVERNRFGARMLQQMMGDVEAYLACCQLGITMASLGLGWVGEPTVAALLQPVLIPLGMSESALHFTSFITGFLVFSSLHIVIGEQVPKTLAIRQPEPVSQWIAYPLYASYILFYPLNWLLNAASRGTLALLGVQEASPHEILTGVEIEGLVGESAEHGGFASGEAE